ncbi:hypothetical protein DKX38_027965 [Salix brachista]|uniref:Serine aminopeptidase S33 domain-containing protein n=1 Tax=Salix brachista TaxID=2182728 RepID=A0A5N5J4D1_9ROSI|nr:hypothetical protein DKX38_027965 [Salix brachista]
MSTMAEMEPLTSGASNRIIPILKALRTALLFIHALVLSVLVLLLPRRYRRRYTADSAAEQPPRKSGKRWRLEEEDTFKRRALAEGIDMTTGNEDCRCSTFLFYGVRRNALFTRSWFPVTGQKKEINIGMKDLKDKAKLACNLGIDVIITLFESVALSGRIKGLWCCFALIYCGFCSTYDTSLACITLLSSYFLLFFLRVDSVLRYEGYFVISGAFWLLFMALMSTANLGRYAQFAKQLTSCNFGVYAMDWTGHGGSDGLHGYVPSLDHVVADTGAFLEKIKSENPGVPCFLFGHSTGGAVVLKAASYPNIEEMLEGIVLTSPALRVKPAHPIVGAVAPFFSLVIPKFQFKGANKRGIPVSRDPAALLAKYSDPLVYTGPIRVRTGHEILRISSYLLRNFKSVTVPFLVLHGTADKVTDPLASQDLYSQAASKFKDIKLYDGFLHDLLFEPEREEVGQDIISWMEKKIRS